MSQQDKLTTEHIHAKIGNRFERVNDAIRLAEFWIKSGREPLDSENTAVEVMNALSHDPLMLERVDAILAAPPEPKVTITYQQLFVVDDEDEDDDE